MTKVEQSKEHNPYEWATCILCDKEEPLSFFELLKNIDPKIRNKIYVCDRCKNIIIEDFVDYTDDFRDVYQTFNDIMNKFSIEELRKKVKDNW